MSCLPGQSHFDSSSHAPVPIHERLMLGGTGPLVAMVAPSPGTVIRGTSISTRAMMTSRHEAARRRPKRPRWRPAPGPRERPTRTFDGSKPWLIAMAATWVIAVATSPSETAASRRLG